ncbi:MAG TPA: hypothetical protein VGO45_01765 [Bacteroidia bacterium]|jgi:hypothetical protein|nr:hypothetical protein [Bacteroidia bacterium]
MKKHSILGFIFILATFCAHAQVVLVLDGNYQGKNLYVQNPFGNAGVGFCVTEVSVNGNVTTDEIASSAFEIDLKNFQLKLGDPVEVKIKYKGDCQGKPKVLNPEVLKPKSTYEVIKMDVGTEGSIKFTTKGESGKLAFIIEEYRWNKWVKVGEVEGLGTNGPNDYTFKAVLHSGENKFRLKQLDYSGTPRYSKEIKVASPTPKITFAPVKVSSEITFTGGETMYEIYDQYGNMVKKGFGATIDCKNLPKGAYYLNYDNSTGDFLKK